MVQGRTRWWWSTPSTPKATLRRTTRGGSVRSCAAARLSALQLSCVQRLWRDSNAPTPTWPLRQPPAPARHWDRPLSTARVRHRGGTLPARTASTSLACGWRVPGARARATIGGHVAGPAVVIGFARSRGTGQCTVVHALNNTAAARCRRLILYWLRGSGNDDPAKNYTTEPIQNKHAGTVTSM